MVLDDHEEMMKGRQKELNSLNEMGADDSCENVSGSWQQGDSKHDG